MTLDIHRQRETGDMARFNLEEDFERRGRTSITHRSCPELVDPLQHLLLDRGDLGIGIALTHLAQQCLFGQNGRSFECSPDPHADNYGRTGIGTGFLYAVDDEILYAVNARRRGQHVDAAHVLRPAPFRDGHYFYFFSGDNIVVDYRRGVVPCIFSGKGIAGRLSQISVPVRLTYAFVEGIPDVPADNVDILADIDEQDGETRILAERIFPFRRDSGVFFEFLENLPGHGRFIAGDPPLEGSHDILTQIIIGIDQ